MFNLFYFYCIINLGNNMKKKDIIITISLIILAIITIIASFSYAFLYKEEGYDNVSMQVGTLNYNLSSTLLTNNSISLESNEKARLNIEIESLNNINTKYQLYYQTTNNNIEIGYVSDNSLPEGIINANSKKTVTVIIKNKTSSNATITFGVEGGFITNDISLELNKLALVQIENYTSNSCALALNTVYDFDYNGTDGTDGSEQVFNVPCNGVYKLETWGAQGGNASSTYIGGYGGYSVGLIKLRRSTNLYINVGGQGSTNHNSKTNGGYNGGGYTHETRNDTYEGSGGGATHIALTSGVLSLLQEFKGELIDNKYYSSKNILIVAGGGGAGSYYTSGGFDGKGGSGGGYIGVNGYFDTHNHYGNGGTQISGGASNVDSYGITSSYPSGFGFGSYADGKNLSVGTSGGGSGFFGGGAGVHSGAGGGSGYIANENLIDKMMYCYDCQESSETELFTVNTIGTSNLKDLTNCPNGYSDEPVSKCAKLGNGYARITFLSETPQEEKTTIGYVITYNPNNGILDNNFKIIEYGKEIGTLPTPTRGTDYFEGWYLEDTFTTKVDSTYVPTGNITLYARYGTEIN